MKKNMAYSVIQSQWQHRTDIVFIHEHKNDNKVKMEGVIE